MSVTVIATGFPTSDGSAFNDNKEEESQNFEEPVKDDNKSDNIDEEDFTDIMSIFNRK
jgi:hypothetical protein